MWHGRHVYMNPRRSHLKRKKIKQQQQRELRVWETESRDTRAHTHAQTKEIQKQNTREGKNRPNEKMKGSEKANNKEGEIELNSDLINSSAVCACVRVCMSSFLFQIK